MMRHVCDARLRAFALSDILTKREEILRLTIAAEYCQLFGREGAGIALRDVDAIL
jgi:hypothetical protein